jgi:sulfite reductase (NADPH) flavoprotein alpha-component
LPEEHRIALDEWLRCRCDKFLVGMTQVGDEKIYVQHRMRDDGRDLWAWLERGAHIYVCGDALRMAKDVERALIDVVAAHGKRSPEDAARYVAELKRNDRYQLDVY